MQVHLLRVACSSKGPLADALPRITDELHQLGVCLLYNMDSQIMVSFYLENFLPFPLKPCLKGTIIFLKSFQILSEGVLDLASKSSSDFNRTFEDVFNQNMVRKL